MLSRQLVRWPRSVPPSPTATLRDRSLEFFVEGHLAQTASLLDEEPEAMIRTPSNRRDMPTDETCSRHGFYCQFSMTRLRTSAG